MIEMKQRVFDVLDVFVFILLLVIKGDGEK